MIPSLSLLPHLMSWIHRPSSPATVTPQESDGDCMVRHGRPGDSPGRRQRAQPLAEGTAGDHPYGDTLMLGMVSLSPIDRWWACILFPTGLCSHVCCFVLWMALRGRAGFELAVWTDWFDLMWMKWKFRGNWLCLVSWRNGLVSHAYRSVLPFSAVELFLLTTGACWHIDRSDL
jgi:hypothetical protein